jgi:hypothetical protein
MGRGVQKASPPAKAVAKKNGETKAAKKPARAWGDDPRVVKRLGALRSDPALAPIVDAFEESQSTARKFGSNGLKVNGSLFALFTQGTLVVKLPKERVAVLVDARIGEPFDPGHGRRMKEWLTVTDTKVSWSDLAKEAHRFVKSAGRASRTIG